MKFFLDKTKKQIDFRVKIFDILTEAYKKSKLFIIQKIVKKLKNQQISEEKEQQLQYFKKLKQKDFFILSVYKIINQIKVDIEKQEQFFKNKIGSLQIELSKEQKIFKDTSDKLKCMENAEEKIASLLKKVEQKKEKSKKDRVQKKEKKQNQKNQPKQDKDQDLSTIQQQKDEQPEIKKNFIDEKYKKQLHPSLQAAQERKEVIVPFQGKKIKL